jgi:hypothetical protein
VGREPHEQENKSPASGEGVMRRQAAKDMLDMTASKRVKPSRERSIEDRCRLWIYQIESTDDLTQLTELVHRIVAIVQRSPKIAAAFLAVETGLRQSEGNIEARVLAQASDEELAAFIYHSRRNGINREARDHIRAACEGGPVTFSVTPELLCQ